MHEIYLYKVPETLGFITQTAPITIMTRSPVAATTRFLYDPYSSLSSLSSSSFFFSDKIVNSQGNEISTREIKQKLREVIEQEDKTNPITDDQLVTIMHESGYPIARRTVAKYREQMNIPVARIRRQLLK